jgi:hypothetical protein
LIQHQWFIHPIVFFKHITRVENKTLQKSLVNLYFDTIHRQPPPRPEPPMMDAEEEEWDDYDEAMDNWEVRNFNPLAKYRFVHSHPIVKLLLDYIEAEHNKPAKQRTSLYVNFLKRMIDSIDETDLNAVLHTPDSQKTVFENLAQLTLYSQTKMTQTVWGLLDKTFTRETYADFVKNAFAIFIETEKLEPEMQSVQEKLILKLLKEKTEETFQTLRIPLVQQDENEEEQEIPDLSVLAYAVIYQNTRAIAFLLNLGATVDEQDEEYLGAPQYQRLINLPKFTSTIQDYYKQHYYSPSHRSQTKRTTAFNQHLEEFKSDIKNSARSRQSPRSPSEIHLSLRGGTKKTTKKPKRF